MASSSSGFDSDFNESTIAACARFFSVSERTISYWLAEGCPGERGRYPLPEMVEWAKANKWFKSSDPMLAGGDSDNLERYRGLKADLAEMDLQERRQQMVNLDAIKPAFIGALGHIKNAGEKLDRQFGNEALAILLDAWDQAMEYIAKELPDDEETPEPKS